MNTYANKRRRPTLGELDVLLVQPPLRDFYLTNKRSIPYGLACIAAVLQARGFRVAILDALATRKKRALALPESMRYLAPYYGRPDCSPFGLFHQFKHFGYQFQHLAQVARHSKASLIGIASLFTAYSDEALKTAEAIKSAHPNGKIVMGGHHPTVLPEAVMQCRAVDFILRGEAEYTMPLLTEALNSGRRLDVIPGIVMRRSDGSLLIKTPAVSTPLDGIRPAHQLLPNRFYRRRKHGTAVVVASRGCPLRCNYCSVGGSAWLPYRRRSVDSVLEEIKVAVIEHGVRFIDFEDEHLTLDRGWIMRLLRGLQRQRGGDLLELRAMNGLYPPSLDERMVAMMRRAGFKVLNLSLGTTAPDQLRRFRRADVRPAFEQILTWAARYDLQTVGYMIAAAPAQNATASLNDLLYLADKRILVGISIYYPAPGSADWPVLEARNLLPSCFALMRASALPMDGATSRLEAVTLLRLGRIVNFMKALVDQEGTLPKGKELAAPIRPPIKNRTAVGRRLLAAFLCDGRIRGVTPQGQLYEHTVCLSLTHQFLKRLKIVAGATSSRAVVFS